MKKKSIIRKDTNQSIDSALRVGVPAWVPEKEAVGSAMMATGQEMILAIEDCLSRYHNFTEKEIKQLEEEMKHLLGTLGEVERERLSILNPRDMAVIGEIAEIRTQREMTAKTGIALPPPNKSAILSKLIK